MNTPDLKELERFRQDCGIPDLPTPLTYDLRRAISGEGPRASDWEDKPHRLVFDACREIEAKAREADELRAALRQIEERFLRFEENPVAVVNWMRETARAALGERK